MADTKEVQNIRKKIQLRAIQSHAGFIDYVAGMVEKVGIEAIAKAKDGEEFYYLKGMYKRLLDFAEEIQLRMVPQKLEGDFNHTVEMPTIEKGNRLLEYNIGNN